MTTPPKPAASHAAERHALDLGNAVNAAIAAGLAMDPRQISADGKLFLTLPKDFALVAVPDASDLPVYAKEAVTVDDRESLVRYVNRFRTENTVLVADYDAISLHGLIDYHPADTGRGGARRHSVVLKLRPSEEFARWNALAGKLHEQEVFAAFLEENAMDVIDPESATLVEISRDFEAYASHTYKSSVRLDNGDRRLVFETETRAQNAVVIPQRFTVAIPLYNGEEPDTLTALFRWRASGDGKVRLGFEWHRVEYRRQAHFTAIAHAVSEATGRPLVMGRIAS